MRMNVSQIKQHIETSPYCIIFEYDGEWCGFDPQGRGKVVMWYGQNVNTECQNSEQAINTDIFNGKSLKDICKGVEFYQD